MGPFAGYADNARADAAASCACTDRAVEDINPTLVADADLLEAAREAWDAAVERGAVHGFRNAQATVLAPTGTIGFMMDCDTTGVEPDIALVKYKKLVGGGVMKIVNNTVPSAPAPARLQRGRGRGDRRVHRRERDHRGRARPQGRAPAGVRLRLQADQRDAVDPLHRPHHDDGRRAAVHLRSDLQDGQHAPRGHGRGDHEAYIAGMEDRGEGLAIYRDGCKRTQPLQTAQGREEGTQAAMSRAPSPSRVRRAAGRARGHHAQFSDRGSRRLHHRRACTRTAVRARSS